MYIKFGGLLLYFIFSSQRHYEKTSKANIKVYAQLLNKKLFILRIWYKQDAEALSSANQRWPKL